MADSSESLGSLQQENLRLRLEKDQLAIENRILELKVAKLERMMWGKKSERLAIADDRQTRLFNDPTGPALPVTRPAPAVESDTKIRKLRKKMGPKPLDPALRREVIAVPPPDLKLLICPVTNRPMQPGWVEPLEVLARRPPQYYVKRYERTVFVSDAKIAPVYSPWPSNVLPRSRVDASIVAYLAAAHYCEHLPFYRIEQDLARKGVIIPRNSQVSLMQQLDRIMEPLLHAKKQDIFAGGYIYLDPTPVDMCDPARPGETREATLWAYRSQKTGAVWFEYQTSKSPAYADTLLKAVNFRGFCQTDGAPGLDTVGPPGFVINLGCWTHVRRRFFENHRAGDLRATWYLEQIGKLFRIDRIAAKYGLTLRRKAGLRQRFSVPIFEALMKQAEQHAEIARKGTLFGDAVLYLLGQQERLLRCLTHAEAELCNNPVERAIRPLKLGAKNWLFIGHPKAGPRLANLFTIVENCRLLGIDPESYLTDIITRLPDYPAAKIAELLPHHWRVSKSGLAETVGS